VFSVDQSLVTEVARDQKLKRKPVITVVAESFRNPADSPSSTFEYAKPA